MRTPFVVGRATAGSTELVVLTKGDERPFPGPWVLRGVVDVRTAEKLSA